MYLYKQVKHLFNCLSHLGIKRGFDELGMKQISLCNRMAILLSAVSFVYLWVFLYLGIYLIAKVMAIVTVMHGLSLFLNHRGRSKIAKYHLIFSCSVAIGYSASYLGREVNLQVVLYSLLILPLVLFELEHYKKVFLGMLIPASTYLVLEITNYGLIQNDLILEKPVASLLFYAMVLTSISISIMAILFYYKLSKKEQISKIRMRTQEALHRQDAFGTLIQGIGHELKNSIGITINYLEVTQDCLGDVKAADEMLEKAIGGIERLNKTLDTILEHGMGGGKDHKPVVIDEVIKEIIAFATPMGKKRNVQLICSLNQSPVILGNAIELQQVLINLLLNAFEAGSTRIEVKTCYEERHPLKKATEISPCLKLTLADNGKGIEEEIQSKIFDAFFTTYPKKTGLGLSIVEKIVFSHGGDIEVESALHTGTKIHVFLPALTKAYEEIG